MNILKRGMGITEFGDLISVEKRVLDRVSCKAYHSVTAMKHYKLESVFGQSSYVISSDRVSAAVTRTGGHLAPVTFKLGRRSIRPFAIAPWWNEKPLSTMPALLRVLRGDFFCLPFGGNAAVHAGEAHPPHGETSNSRWRFGDCTSTNDEITLQLTLDTAIRPGHVRKRITLVRGQTAVYQEHVISGMSGPMSLGHHATLKFPDQVGAGRISTSASVHRQVFPEPMELPEQRGYSCLKPGAVFSDLSSVPTITGEAADVSRYPARRGFEDLVLLAADPQLAVAWSAVAFPAQGYVWFSLRDPQVLASTVLWISNAGRHYPPWNGRHFNVMGIEDITGFFHYGLAESAAPNDLSERGIKTHLLLKPRQPLSVRYIMGLAAIPKDFERVRAILIDDGSVTLVSDNDITVNTPIHTGFLRR